MKSKEDIKQDILTLLDKAEGARSEQKIETAMEALEKAKKCWQNASGHKEVSTIRNKSETGSKEEIVFLAKFANILYDIGEYRKALEAYKMIHHLEATNITGYKGQGDCYRKLKQYELALEQYAEGLKVSSTRDEHGAVLNSRGLTYIDMAQYEKALKDFEEAIQNTENPLYYCNQGHALHKQGNEAGALKAFQKAEELAGSGREFAGLSPKYLESVKYNLKTFIEVLEVDGQVSLKEADEILATRKSIYVGDVVNGINNPGTFYSVDGGKQINAAKSNLAIIQEHQEGHRYYKGFLAAFQNSYVSAQVISDGQVSVDTGSGAVDLPKNIMSLIPVIGDSVAKCIDIAKSICDVAKSAEIKTAADNIADLDMTPGDIQDLAIKITTDNLETISRIKPEPILDQQKSMLEELMEKCAKKFKIPYNVSENKKNSPMYHVGSHEAHTLLQKYVATAEIYQGLKYHDDLIDSERDYKLSQFMCQILEEDTEISKGKLIQPKSHKPNKKGSCSGGQCYVFKVTIEYDDPLMVLMLQHKDQAELELSLKTMDDLVSPKDNYCEVIGDNLIF